MFRIVFLIYSFSFAMYLLVIALDDLIDRLGQRPWT
jgi:hypothetical protein